MPAIFPTLHPEEPFFSAVSRFAEAMAFPDDQLLVLSLFGIYTHRDPPTAEFPGWLEQLVARLPPGHPYTVEGLLLRHTPLPYVAPFYPRRRVRAAANSIRSGAPRDPRKPLFEDGHHRMMRSSLRYCTGCVAADEAAGVIPYWRRVHQLTGVVACPEHRIPLRVTWVQRDWVNSEDRNRGRLPGLCSLALALGRNDPAFALDDATLEVALAVADDSLWLLRHPQMGDSLGTVMERHRARLAEAGWTDAAGRIRRDGLGKMVAAWTGRLFETEFGHHILHNLWFNIYDRRMWNGPDGRIVPFYHILLFRALGLSAPEFFSGPPPEVIRRTPRMRVEVAPCRNPVCVRFSRSKLTPATGVELAVVSCPDCRHMYVRRSDGNRAQVKTLRYGDLWDERLRVLSAAGTALPEVARLLHTREKRVAREALRIRAWHRKWPRELRVEVEEKRRARPRDSPNRSRFRGEWRRATGRRIGLQWALSQGGRAFRYLLRADTSWLAAHMDEPYVPRPTAVPQASSPPAADEAVEQAGPVYQAASFLRAWAGFPIPVTPMSLRLLLRTSRTESRYAYGYTDADLQPYLDTPQSYARRRIMWAARRAAMHAESAGPAELAGAACLTSAEAGAFSSELAEAAAQLGAFLRGEAPPPAEWFPHRRRV